MDIKIRKVAITAAREAGQELMRRFKNFDRNSVKLKASHEILTSADLASEKIILSHIKQSFPLHRILSEEAGDTEKKSDYLWIVDPLDGTTNFSMHNPIWSISIGVAHKGEIVLGVIYAPYLDELYLAEKNKGAKKNDKAIKVSKHTTKAIHTFCHGGKEKYIKKALAYLKYQKLHEIDCRQMGSAALELAYTAVGRVESIMIPGANPWDVAAGVLLVREAGGRVTDFEGKNWNLQSQNIIASNGKVHKNILNTLNKI